MCTPGRIHLSTLALFVWIASASPPTHGADLGPLSAVDAEREDRTRIPRNAATERVEAFVPAEGLVAQGGGPAGQSGPCMQERERRAIDEAIERYRQLHGVFAPATVAAAPPKFPFFPMGGQLYRDLFTVMFVDLDPSSPGILDWDCTEITYNGHRGVDVMLRTFTEQEIGVPIFAALDGVVVDSHDGEDDHHTEPIGQQFGTANYVVIDHGSGRFCSYLHMRLNSVMVSPGQLVKAGQQIGFTASSGMSAVPHLHFETHDFGAVVDPYTGPCNPGESQWVEQTPIRRDSYLWDMSITDVDLEAFPPLPFDFPRTGTFVQGFRTVYFLFRLINRPPNSSFRARYQRPDSSIAFDSGALPFGNQFFAQEWWYWNGFNVNLNVAGTWHILLDINGEAMAAAPFDVVSSADQIVNRPPYPITVSLDPPVPAAADTIFCLVNTDLVLDDPDYDVVRYHYVWRVDGQIVRDIVSAGHADAIPHHTASPDSLLECTVTPSDGEDDGPPVSVSAVLDAVSKFDQLPDGTGEAIASNLDWTDSSPNVVVADDFVSDGRPITAVRWWGTELAPPLPDGWLISFHEPLSAGGSAELPLGLYFCDSTVVMANATVLTACDALSVVEYEVSLEDCCLIHATNDSRSPLQPAQPDAFYEQLCFQYDIDIQAVVGHKFVGSGATCTEESTGNSATVPFWGWHTTGIENGKLDAWQSTVSMSGSDWLYGPWTPASPMCSAPNMAFALLTNQNSITIDCNDNGTPDVCESGPDCQPDGVPDECEVANGTSKDCNGGGIPDECELSADPDCNANGILDACDMESVGSLTGALAGVLGFVDIAAAGTPLNLSDDGTATVTMPFAPAAFDTARVRISNNGGVGLGGSVVLSNPNRTLPHLDAFNGDEALLVFWDDLHELTGNVYYQTIGSTPNQTFIVQWDDLEQFNLADGTLDGNEVTFQIQIFESPVGGVVAQYLYADTNFFNATYNDGRSATVGYQRSPTSAIQWSFNAAGAVNPSVVISLLAGDRNSNGLPDSCDPPGNIVWDSSPLSSDRTTRSLRFRVSPPVTATGTPLPDAVKVTMIDLQHPVPANLPQYPPKNYTTFDTRSNGVCSGGALPGHHCDSDADCMGGACTSLAACAAAGEDLTPDAGGGFQGGCARWVGKPGTFMESQGPPSSGPFRAARLQCTPFYHDWVTETAGGTIAVVGAEIVPSSEYNLQAYGVSCMGAEGSCTNVSAPMQMFTRRSGDAASLFSPPEASGQPNSLDVTALVNKFKGAAGAPVKAISQLQPNLPELNADVGALDIVACVDAVKELAYAYSGPCPCPSQANCVALACSTPATCTGSALPGLGTGALCVLSCIGGENAGGPCINNSHCPGGACPASGFCRDRCGRCSP